jgi:hypothetical protein
MIEAIFKKYSDEKQDEYNERRSGGKACRRWMCDASIAAWDDDVSHCCIEQEIVISSYQS